YQRVCAAAGAHAGVVDLASLNLINAVLAGADGGPAGDWLVVHVAPEYATLGIPRGRDLIFFRSRQLDTYGDLTDLVHQTAMYHEDRLSGGRFGRVIVSGAAARRSAGSGRPELVEGRGADAGERAWRSLEERLGVRVEPIDFR